MSTNCVRCVVNTRTKFDGLCDRCRIIDAAPDLLAACEAAKKWIENSNEAKYAPKALRQLGAAIAKARGEKKP